MADITAHHSDTAAPSLLSRVFDSLIRIGENNRRARELERLMTISDEALAKRGLTRADLVRHVFPELGIY